MLTRLASDWDRTDRDPVVLAIGAGDLHAGMAGLPIAERDRQGQFLDRELPSAGLTRTKTAAPVVGRHLARILEAHPEQLPRGLVVEEKRAGLVDQESRSPEGRDQAPRLDQLDRPLRSGHAASVTRARLPGQGKVHE